MIHALVRIWTDDEIFSSFQVKTNKLPNEANKNNCSILFEKWQTIYFDVAFCHMKEQKNFSTNANRLWWNQSESLKKCAFHFWNWNELSTEKKSQNFITFSTVDSFIMSTTIDLVKFIVRRRFFTASILSLSLSHTRDQFDIRNSIDFVALNFYFIFKAFDMLWLKWIEML